MATKALKHINHIENILGYMSWTLIGNRPHI